MRLACGLAIALWLGLPAAGMAPQQQEPAGSANSAGQAPAAPAEPAEAAPAEGQKAAESASKEKTDTGSASGTSAGTSAGTSPGTSASGTVKRRKRAVPAQDGGPRKIVVREGGASEPAAQIAPDMTPAEAARQRQNAERLLGSAADQLKLLAERTLDARQQETVGQIRNYMGGARSALQEGDLRRASLLAQKAHLLADDLVKH
ncbi:MAG: hypothetical protein ABSF66_07780 [Terriglobales bacterium]